MKPLLLLLVVGVEVHGLGREDEDLVRYPAEVRACGALHDARLQAREHLAQRGLLVQRDSRKLR